MEEGRPAYHRALLLKVWLYAYALGVTSARRLEQQVREDLAFRYLAAGAGPDFWTLNQFRTRHARALNDLFTQVESGYANPELQTRADRNCIEVTNPYCCLARYEALMSSRSRSHHLRCGIWKDARLLRLPATDSIRKSCSVSTRPLRPDTNQ